MSEELTDFLNTAFPMVFRGRMGKGCYFECGDGWFDIIYNLAYQLEKEINKISKEELDLGLCTAVQIKEKYGTLRFYMSTETDKMSKLIAKAEARSEVTCEKCGDKGKLRTDGWYTTLCTEHYKERNA